MSASPRLDGRHLGLRLGLVAGGAAHDQRLIAPAQFIVAHAFGHGNHRRNFRQFRIILGGDAGIKRDDHIRIGGGDLFKIQIALKDFRRGGQQHIGPGPDSARIVTEPVFHRYRLDAQSQKVIGAVVVDRGDTLGRCLDHGRSELVVDGQGKILRQCRNGRQDQADKG